MREKRRKRVDSNILNLGKLFRLINRISYKILRRRFMKSKIHLGQIYYMSNADLFCKHINQVITQIAATLITIYQSQSL